MVRNCFFSRFGGITLPTGAGGVMGVRADGEKHFFPDLGG